MVSVALRIPMPLVELEFSSVASKEARCEIAATSNVNEGPRFRVSIRKNSENALVCSVGAELFTYRNFNGGLLTRKEWKEYQLCRQPRETKNEGGQQKKKARQNGHS